MSRSTPPAVRLGRPEDLALAVPHLLGFHPRESIVAAALSAPSGRVAFTMRVALPMHEHEPAVAADIARRMAGAGADRVLLAVFTATAPDGNGRLPHASLVTEIEAMLEVPVHEALLVREARCWSYQCDDRRCCPAEGRPVPRDSAAALALEAASALSGAIVMPDRESLVATVLPVAGERAVQMRAALARAVTAPPLSLAAIRRLSRRYDEPPVTLLDDEAAAVVLALHRVPVRDQLLQRLARGDERLAPLVRDVAWLAQPPLDAPVATLLAATAYLRGEGAVAGAALERALDTEPDYGLALLLLRCLEQQIEPARLRAIWADD